MWVGPKKILKNSEPSPEGIKALKWTCSGAEVRTSSVSLLHPTDGALGHLTPWRLSAVFDTCVFGRVGHLRVWSFLNHGKTDESYGVGRGFGHHWTSFGRVYTHFGASGPEKSAFVIVHF